MFPPFPQIQGVEFRHVPDWPGYAASSDGFVWSCKIKGGRWPTSEARRLLGRWKKLKGSKQDGYIKVALYGDDGRYSNPGVHQLVLLAFRGPAGFPGAIARHFPDPCRHNNKIENLRWGTPADNGADKIAHGNSLRGAKNNRTKLTPALVLEIRRRATAGEKKKHLAAEFGIGYRTIFAVLNYETWAYLP
jgi:hypothetical protein